MPLRKKVSYVGLKDYNYVIRDTNPVSRDYFNVIQLPDKFKAGKNLFKLRAHPSNLVNNSEIFIEILDYNGNPIYYEPLLYIEKDGTRVIAVYIYSDTSPGDCTIYIAGRAAVDVNTGESIPYSVVTRNEPNILWSRELTVAPDDRNDVEIIYTKYPKVTVTEVVQAYLQPSNVYNTFTQRSGSGTITITPVNNQTLNSRTVIGPATTVPQGAQSAGTPSYGTQFYDLTSTADTLGRSNSTTTLSPPLNTLNGYSLLTTSGFSLSQSMEGGVIVVNNPTINIQASTRGKANLVYPDSQYNETNTSYSTSTAQLSGSIKFAIVNVISSTKALVAQFNGFKNAADNTFGPFNVTLRKNDTSLLRATTSTTNTYSVNAVQASANFTASFVQPTTTVLTQNSASFADIILTDIEPATGDVYSIKTLYKPSGFFGDFIDLGNTILEQNDLLVDTGSLETNVSVGSYYENYGRFDDLAEINQYWETSGLGTVSSPFTITYDNDTIIGGARLLADWQPGNQYVAGIGDAGIFNIKQAYRPTVTKNTDYIVKFRVANDSTITNYSSADINIPNARLDVYISGSRLNVQEEFRSAQFGEIRPVPNFNATLTGNFSDNGVLGTRIGTYQSKFTPSAYLDVEFKFKALDDGPVDIKLVSRNGSFIIADVQLLADKETGYSPNYIRLNKRIPVEHLNTPLTFKFQYFDYRGNKADLESIAYGAVFDGENTYIDGNDNLITGSIFVGTQTNSGIEIAANPNGLIRSTGFTGVDSGSKPGFMLYSGSVLRSATNEFVNGGVGFTTAATTSSYIRVSSVNEELTIKSPGFTLSTTKGGNVITSFTGSVEISGSTVHNGYIQLNPVTTNIDNSISASYIYVSGSTNDLYFTQNGEGYSNTTRLRWLEGNLYTGLLYGGRITSASSTTFNISSGSGIIVTLNATTNREPYPTIRYINWPNLTNQSLTYLNFAIQTFIGIDSSGSIIQQMDPWTDGQYNTSIALGTVLHQNLLSINGSISYPGVAYGYKQRTYDFIKAFGPLKLSGYSIYTSGSLGLTVGSGSAFADGRNYQIDPNNPSYIVDPGTTVSKIFRYYVSASTYNQDTNAGAGYTTIDPSQYNNNGVLSSISPSTPWSNQRVFWYPNSVTKAIVVYYGSAVYASDTEAIANLPYEAFFETPNTQQNAVYLGTITIKYNGTFATPSDYRILPAGIFRNVGGSGGGTSIPAGGSTTPGGSNTQIQYNNSSAFGGSPNFTFVSSSNSVFITGSLTVSGSSTFRNIGPTQLTGSLDIIGNTTLNGNVTINGTASISYLNVQYETASIIYSTGSNQFGDAANDTQTLYGTVRIPTGSLSVTGSVNVSGSVYLRNNQYIKSDFSGGVFNIGVFGVDTNDSVVIGSTYAAGGIVSLTSGVRYDMKATGMGINTASPTAMLHIKGSGATSATTTLRVTNSNSSASLTVLDNGYVGVGTSTPTYKFYASDTGTSGITHFLGFKNDNNDYGGITIGSGVGQNLTIQQNSGYGYLSTSGFRIGSTNGVIWTNNGSIFRIVDAATELINYLRIASTTGNVLINTSTDSGYKFDVSGSIRSTNGVNITGSFVSYTTSSAGFLAIVSGSQPAQDVAFNFQKIGEPTTGARHTMVVEGSGAQDNNIYFGVNQVGGTKGAILAVKGNGSVNINMPSPTGNYGGLAVGGWAASYPSLLVRGYGATSATTTLRVENSNATPSLVVLDNNSVVINASTTSQKLQINGSLNTEYAGTDNQSPGDVMNIVGSGSAARGLGTGSALLFTVPANTDGSNLWAQARILGTGDNSSNGNAEGALFLQTRSSYNPGVGGTWNWRTNMVLRASGNVGIGTKAPLTTLDVSGSGRITNGLTVTGSLIASSFTGSLLGSASYASTASAGGSNTHVQYNNNGVLGGSSRFTFDTFNVRIGGGAGLSTGNTTITGSLIVSSSTGYLDTSLSQWIADGALYDSTGVPSVLWGTGNRILRDSVSGDSINWDSRALVNSGGGTSIDWESNILSSPNYVAMDFSGDLYTTSQLYQLQNIPAQVQNDAADAHAFTGQIITGTIDASVATNNLVYLHTDGIWYALKNLPTVSTKMLGICVKQPQGLVLIEGDIGVSDDNSQGPYVIGADHGLPVYISGTTGVMTTTQPTSGVIRVLGHIYYQSTTTSNWWMMKFKPSNDWTEI